MTPTEFSQHRDNLALGLEKVAEIHYWPYATVAEALIALGGEAFSSDEKLGTYGQIGNLYEATATRIRGCQSPDEVLQAYTDMLQQLGVLGQANGQEPSEDEPPPV